MTISANADARLKFSSNTNLNFVFSTTSTNPNRDKSSISSLSCLYERFVFLTTSVFVKTLSLLNPKSLLFVTIPQSVNAFSSAFFLLSSLLRNSSSVIRSLFSLLPLFSKSSSNLLSRRITVTLRCLSAIALTSSDADSFLVA